MAQLEAQDLAQAVVDRMDDCQDARFKQVMTSLVKHAHAFVRDVQLTPDEWMTAIQFLTATGKMRSEEHTSELQSLMRISYAVFCLKKKNNTKKGVEYAKSDTSIAIEIEKTNTHTT